MKINLDRLCKLAGVETQTKTLNEASNRSYHDDPSVQNTDDPDFRFGKGQLSEAEAHEEEMKEMYEGEDDDEEVEVDEAMLVQEIRRAKKMMAEARQKKLTESKNIESLQETQLRKMIAEEIDGVFKDLNLTSGWVYGKKQPTNRTRGAVNTAFPGIGFRNSK
jgi:hypothetical protein